MKHGSLFSGIGGFDLAAEWMGWENMFHCENNEFCQRVLKYYWPKAETYGDIKTTDFNIWRGRVDILSGGFPCQPFSTAGKMEGVNDPRHLWPQMLRSVQQIQPPWIVGENVRGIVSWNGGMVFDSVQADLENEGYQVLPFLLPAASVGAPHRRDRVWFIAYSHSNDALRHGSGEARQTETESKSKGSEREWVRTITNGITKEGFITYTNGSGSQRGDNEAQGEYSINGNTWDQFPTQSPVCDGNDGLSSRLDGITFRKWRRESVKAGGNAIVPQVAYQIFKTIEQYESLIPLTNPTNR